MPDNQQRPDRFFRDVELLNQSIRDLNGTIKDLRTEMAGTYVRKDVLDPKLDKIEKEIKSHNDWLIWAQRIIIGAVIVALVGLVVYSGGEIQL